MPQGTMELLWRSSHIAGGNASYIEAMYESYLDNPNSIAPEWRDYFDRLPKLNGTRIDIPHSVVREHFALLARARHRPPASPVDDHGVSTEYERKQVRVVQLISAYRQRGHQKAHLDPLGLAPREHVPDLELQFHQLSAADFDTVFQTGALYIGRTEATLREIVDALEQTYCRSVGAEFMHIVSTEERQWIQRRMDSVRSAPSYDASVKMHLLERLTAAEGLEHYLASRYPGTKRFGLEGGESLIPMMDELVQRAGGYGAREIVVGMAHRGRLAVLVNIFGKNPADLFDEFEGRATYQGSGDVKYHQGFSSNLMTAGGETHISLAFNPSHLEIVAPVVEGSVRARQDRRRNSERDQVVPIIIHGDAAFAGQGVVMETFQMSQTRGFCTGGTVHIVLNNQVGFTTHKREDARSTEYCTDVAKMVQAPIFHVNGDDPEAVLFVTQMAMDYRAQFRKDVVIDLVCYRRRGHNEADEPAATQPLMYQKIRSHPTTRTIYAEKLVAEGALAREAERELVEDYRNALVNGRHVAKSLVTQPNTALYVDWRPYLGHSTTNLAVDTSLDLARLQQIGAAMCAIPDGVVVHKQVQKIYDDRRMMTAAAMPVNWGYAELLAYATLLSAGHPVRLTGQDVGRGTFSHRHAVLHNQKDGSAYIPLQHLSPEQAELQIHDSLLSELAVLGFEYGYATTMPNAMVIWEAQFGDFANGAQIVIDQFITSGENKWARLCGLTLLLPHGYEGQGPEHSSARLERFLQLCAEHNIQVCVPTTPAQIYHLLRRQVIRPLRKPLVVFSPKSLLRHKDAVSNLEELASGMFRSVIPEVDAIEATAVTRAVFCSGKVYYELRDARNAEKSNHVAIVRVEQLYPFPQQELLKAIAPYRNLLEVCWCQEEPQNQGAWFSSQHHMRQAVREHNRDLYLEYAGREASAAPAAGYAALHQAQQEKLVRDALGTHVPRWPTS
jgi:2-oxoglutarate dehydrogenase E1 component